MANDVEVPFDCTTCGESRTGSQRNIGVFILCQECVSTLIPETFEKAFACQEPEDYPPKCGDTTLRAEDFLDVLGADFVARYNNVRREYETHSRYKIYCKHLMLKEDGNRHLRGRSATRDEVLALPEYAIEAAATAPDEMPTVQCGAFVEKKSDNVGEVKICYHCNGSMCICCGRALSLWRPTKHDCVPANAGEPSEEEILKHQIQGVDYQRGPNCKNVISLGAGCNTVNCNVCRNDFCYLCGAAAGHDSDDWIRTCPRYNPAGAENAMFDLPSDIEIVDLVVERGNAHLANGGRIDGTWMDAMQAELRTMGTTLIVVVRVDAEREPVVEPAPELATTDDGSTAAENTAQESIAPGDDGTEEEPVPQDPAARLWRKILVMHQDMHNHNRLTLAIYEVQRWRFHGNFDAQFAAQLEAMAAEMHSLLESSLPQEMQAMNGPPPPGEVKDEYVSEYSEVMGMIRGLNDMQAQFPPRLWALYNEFIHSVPRWLWLTVGMEATQVVGE
ncbi:hypothetical protein LTR09_003585 [Extremus antarcticus]|uniref:IBR domain-containing protein n=1 Tax=Extremus antarcticus TaxID=702011 RepID=A0AAJ0DS40_9PEZI|nr:hypothetical protein LTR09_003585 [Extremus antarcticus]